MKSRKELRVARHERIRKKVAGTAARPRMAVMISNRHLYVQFIDDEAGRTIASVSTCGADDGAVNVAAAGQLGKKAAEVAKEKGIGAVVFDRAGFRYHGRIKAIADAAREAGLKI